LIYTLESCKFKTFETSFLTFEGGFRIIKDFGGLAFFFFGGDSRTLEEL